MLLEETKRTLDYGNYVVLKERIRGTLGYICPHCKCMATIHMDKNTNITIDPIDAKVRIRHLTLELTCRECGNAWEVYDDDGIDSLMIEPISILNNNGYATKFSCEGHLDDPSLPYIYFKDDSIKAKGPANEWEFSDQGDGVLMTWRGKFKSNADKVSALDSLYKWIENNFEIKENNE